MAWDTATNQLILFGGFLDGNYTVAQDTWAWTGATWIQLTPTTSPPARVRAAMAMDPATGQLILFGGWGSGLIDLGDTWAWTGTTWMPLTPATSPTARANIEESLAFDATTRGLVLFGGAQDEGVNLLGDTWIYR